MTEKGTSMDVSSGGLSRRLVLKYGIFGTLLLLSGGVGVSLQKTVLRSPKGPLQVLNPQSYSILGALADRICPGGNGLPNGSEMGVPDKVDALLARCHPGIAKEIQLVLQLIENALVGVFFDYRLRPFTASDPETQDQVIENWQQSRLATRRTAYKAIHDLCAASYWSDPRTYEFVGYSGPPQF